MNHRIGWAMLIAVNVLMGCMLCFYQRTSAAPPDGNQPFRNSVEQRDTIVGELKEVNAQLKEINSFLRSGNLRVVVQPAGKVADQEEEKDEDK